MKEYIIEIERTPESVADAIRYAEMELQDNFLEYRDIFHDASDIMKFAHERGYITEEKFNFWKEGFNDNEQGSEETFEVIFSDDEEWEPYCITYKDENSERDYNEQYRDALLVYGELICSKEEYYSQFVKVLQSGEGNLEDLIVEVL